MIIECPSIPRAIVYICGNISLKRRCARNDTEDVSPPRPDDPYISRCSWSITCSEIQAAAADGQASERSALPYMESTICDEESENTQPQLRKSLPPRPHEVYTHWLALERYERQLTGRAAASRFFMREHIRYPAISRIFFMSVRTLVH